MRRSRLTRLLRNLIRGGVLATALHAQQDITEAQPWQFDSFIADADLEGCSILHCATAPDGRIWFATSAGLACYDGYDWTRFRTEHGLPSDYVRCVAFAPSGHCWVGTDRGAVRFDTDLGRAIPTETHLAGPSVRRIVTDPRSDAVWFCCDQWPDPTVSAGLTRMAQGRWQSWTSAQGLPSDYVQTMLIDSRGRHFVGTTRGLVELRDDTVGVPLTAESAGSTVWSITEEANGTILVAIGFNLHRLVDSRWTRLPFVVPALRPLVLASRNGTLSIKSDQRRIFRVDQDNAVPVSAEWGTSSNGIECAMEAPDGAVWLVGHNELLRWRRGGEWRLYSNCPSPVLTDANGGVWFVGRGGTLVFTDDTWHNAGPVTRSLCVDHHGSVWGIQGGRAVRWAGGSLAARQEVATEVAHATRVDTSRSTVVIMGRDAAGHPALIAGGIEPWRRVTVPADFDGTAVTWLSGDVGPRLWVLTHGSSERRRLFHLTDERLEEVSLPATLLEPQAVRVTIDSQGQPWVHGLFGLFERREGSWERITTLPSQHVHAGRRVGDSLAFVTRSTAGGVGGLSLTRVQAGERVWQRVDVTAETALGSDARGRLLLCDNQALYRVDGHGRVSSTRLPMAQALRMAVPGKGNELWLSGGGSDQVLRYVPDAKAPKAHVTWLDSARTENERVVLDLEIREHNKPRAASRDARVFVAVDGVPTQTFTQAQRPFLLSGLATGMHKITAHIEDDSGTPCTTAVEVDVTVSTRPLQERPWFWVVVAALMSVLMMLAAYSFLVGRRLAAQTRSLTETVEQRTNDLRARDEVSLHAKKMEAVGRLAGGVAHDFNNLLTVILGNVDLMRSMRGPGTDADAAATLNEIEDASRRASDLTRQLLTFSRQETLNSPNVDVVASVRALCGLLRRMISGKIDLRLELQDQPLIVRSGRAEIEQVLSNLVVNAADAMPNGGPITVSVRQCLTTTSGGLEPRAFARVEVRDEGCGMTDAVKARAFDPYFTTKTRERGTGLGLAIVHGVLKRVDGFVELDSVAGLGTSVRAFFPVAEKDQPRVMTLPGELPRGDGRTLLLCEDEPAVLQLSVRILEAAGYRVLASSTVQGALDQEAGTRGQLAAVVTDVVTKDRSGVELARELETRRPGVPVLFISGYADQVLEQARLDPASIRLLHKPFDPDALLRAVADTIASTSKVRAGTRLGQSGQLRVRIP